MPIAAIEGCFLKPLNHGEPSQEISRHGNPVLAEDLPLRSRLEPPPESRAPGHGSWTFVAVYISNSRSGLGAGLRVDDAFRELRDRVASSTGDKQKPEVLQDDLQRGAFVLTSPE
jgi:hypothetical protein